MLKWISLILSFIFGAKSSSNFNIRHISGEVFDEILKRSRRPIASLLLGIASVFFISGGLLISLYNATQQYDQSGRIFLGAVFWGGLIVAGIFISIAIYAYQYSTPESLSQENLQSETSTQNARMDLNEAISLLILDHIEERKLKRTSQANTQRKSSESYPPPPPF